MPHSTYQWLQDTAKPGRHSLETRKRIVCTDGFSMSVQANEGSYCTPRDDIGPWSACEIGFPSEPEQAIVSYAEDADKPTETVYGWVPVDVVDAVIAKHGGIKATP